MTWAVVLAVLGQGAFALAPLVQKTILDDSVLHHRRPLGPWVAVLVLTGVVTFVLGYIRRALGGRAAVDVQRDLQVRLHHHLQHLDSARRDEMRTGDIMSRATADITLIQMFLQQLGVTAGNVAQVTVAVVVMLVLSPLLATVIVVGIPLFLVLSMRFRDKTFAASWIDQHYQGAVAGVVEEAITGVRIVKAFGQEDQELGLLAEQARHLFRSRLRTARITARYAPTLQAIPTLCQLGVLALGGWLAMRDHLSLGVFLAFSSYVLQLIPPVRMLSGVLATSEQGRAGAHRVLELLAIAPSVGDHPDAQPLLDPVGAVELDHVTFAYPHGDPVLCDVSVRVAPGERVAIVGTSGSGKSTLALLLARFYDPTAGVVRIDGIDARDITLHTLRRAVAMVFEDSFLFSTSIHDNIAFGRPDAADVDVERAAIAAHAHAFISGLPLGYQTEVGERGFTLSGGQRQRIALARVALANPKVLILDDATSAIDARTEEAIHRSFGDVMADRTTILIAHRASTLALADRIIVLDAGRIVAEGTAEELLASSPLFRDLLTGPEPDGDEALDEVVDQLDAPAWPLDVSREGAPRMSSRASEAAAMAGSGSGAPGHGIGASTYLAGLATASDGLLAMVDRLPALRGEPEVDIEREAAPDDDFSFTTLLRPFVRPLLVGGGLVVVDTITGLAAPLLVRHGIDDGVVTHSRSVLLGVCLVLVAVQAVSWANAMVMTFQTSRTAERMLFGLRIRAFAHLQRLSLDYYEQHMAGKIMTRMTSDIEALAQLLQQGLLTAMVSLLSCAGVAVVLVVLDARLALAVGVIVPVLLVATLWFRRASGRCYLVARERISTLYADLQESLAGVRVSQSFSQQAANEARFVELADSYQQARRWSIELIARFFPFLQLINIVAKAIALTVGAHQLAAGHITPGLLIAFLLYLDLFFAPIQQLSMVFDQWLQAGVAVGQIRELLQTPTSTPAAVEPIDPGRLRGHLRFEDTEFAYASTGLVAMHRLDLDIPAGEIVALVGTTGAGKSTMVKLVARFYDPTFGRVLVDEHPLRRLDHAKYRRQLGYVPQEPFLFSGTVRTNIAYGRPDASDLDVERAARRVGAHELIASLPHGYHTPITEAGASLSAGQRQLLGLARALLVDPAILLLDEATANLDLATEAKVQRAMGLVARGRTTLLIAHRLQTARTARRILVVDDGRIVEDGSHDQLLAAGGRYAEMWSAFLLSDTARGA